MFETSKQIKCSTFFKNKTNGGYESLFKDINMFFRVP